MKIGKYTQPHMWVRLYKKLPESFGVKPKRLNNKTLSFPVYYLSEMRRNINTQFLQLRRIQNVFR
jgi:hypothetical protein